MVGNQPRLKLVKTAGDTYEFDLVKNSGIDVKKEQHMHALKMTFEDDDHILKKRRRPGSPARRIGYFSAEPENRSACEA